MRTLIEEIDQVTRVIYLEVPGANVVLLQGYFETYEGLGTVRTLDIRSSLVCILTTASILEDCLNALDSIKAEIGWRMVEPNVELRDRYLGYFKRSGHLA